jgi:hypothetical protein
MENLEELSNNEILFKIKQFEADFEAIKLKMLSDYDKMTALEEEFLKANRILLKRLKGDE